MFDYMANYANILKSLYETPEMDASEGDDNQTRCLATDLIQKVRSSGRTLLTEHESKLLLSYYGIPTIETRIATDADQAITAAREIGFPVVLKLHSETITHKTDVGGVKLNLQDEDEVRAAFNAIQNSVRKIAGENNFLGVTVQPMAKLEGYELIVGSSIDPQFGPVLLFGLGGQLVEVFKDRALALPPLNNVLARRMMERTKVNIALKGVRGRQSVNMAELEQILVKFSQLVSEQPWVKELDINPLIASPEQVIALDARVVLFGLDTQEKDLPKLAIRPYPAQYVSSWKAKNGEEMVFRPIRPEDEPMMVAFHHGLSDRSVYLRYHYPMQLIDRIDHERLARISHIDYNRVIALVVERTDPVTHEKSIIGAGRLSKLHGKDDGRFSILVSDCCQGLGIGNELLKKLIQVAKAENLEHIEALLVPENSVMLKLCEKQGFTISKCDNDTLLKAQLKIK
jgi:acetyltransferase